MTEDFAPEWYVQYFMEFGYTRSGLDEAWRGLSGPARERYRQLLECKVDPS